MSKGIRDSRLRGNDNKRLLRPPAFAGVLAMTIRKPPRNDNKAVNF